jgi:hypothetical protein
VRDEDVARAAYLAFSALRDDLPGWDELEEGERRYYANVVRRNAAKVKCFGPKSMYEEAKRQEELNEETGLLTRVFAGVIWAYAER